MRAGGCTLQQTLTTEAASVLKHSLSLARRRGHAQVTPLHVAATLLSSRASLLRRACLKSQPHQSSHPLQCRALELCFNVALNRLPTTPAPLLHAQPSLSNALIAALKRAQAHQRRGCIEQQQQQPLLTIKVELEQLIISILDDPSVSRVMREAGFSSTAVKNNLEDSSASSVFQCYSSSAGVFSSPCSPSRPETAHLNSRDMISINPTTFWQTHFLNYSSDQNPLLFSPQNLKKHNNPTTTDSDSSVKEDLKLVVEVLLRKKRRNTVIVGDSVSITEGLVSELMGRVERGEVPEELKSAHLIKFQFTPVSLKFMKREDVEMNLSELKRKVNSVVSGGGGAIIYAGDLKWTVEASVNSERDIGGEVSACYYSPVDHLVAEIGRLLSDYCTSNTKVWLMVTATYQTYMKCQMKQPPLEIQWALQAVSVPSGGLGLSLHASSVHDSKMTFSHNPSRVLETKPFSTKEEQDKLTCCAECMSNYEKEAAFLKSGQQKHLPSWLQPKGTDARQKDELVELRRKWNRLCHNIHYGNERPTQNHLSSSPYNSNQTLLGKSYSYNSSYPWWPNSPNTINNSISFAPNHTSTTTLMPRYRRQQSFTFGDETPRHQAAHEPRLDCFNNNSSDQDKEVKITLALGNSAFSSHSGISTQQQKRDRGHICKLLQENVPWQTETIPSIVEALIDSKSINQETCNWLLIQGNDSIGKRRLALSIAEAVFGSADLFFHVNMRKTDNNGCSETLARALKTHKKLVVLVENVDFADTQFMKFLADGFETGKFGEYSCSEKEQAIFILTKGDDSTSFEDKKMNHNSVIQMKMVVNGSSSNFDHKRKAEWDLSNKTTKNSRMDDERENRPSASVENGNCNKDLSRQSSFNTLDLNIKANEDEDSEEKPGELSPISSDLTRETVNDLRNPHGFVELIEKRFVLNGDPAGDRGIKEVLLSKIKEPFEEVLGRENMGCFTVEHRVLEEMLVNSASYLNSLFEKWLKDVVQTSLQTVKIGGKEGMGVRLCFGGKCGIVLEDGYMGSSLPRKIQLSFVD